MPAEHSAGVIPYYQRGAKRKFLFLLSGVSQKGFWEFPKGLIEKGEDPQSAAVREFQEETGIDRCKLIPGFKHVVKYVYKRDGKFIFKTVTYFLGKVATTKVQISWESKGYAWMEVDEALRKIKHKNFKELLQMADEFLSAL